MYEDKLSRNTKTETTVFVMCGHYEFVQDHKKGIYAADAKFSAVEMVQN